MVNPFFPDGTMVRLDLSFHNLVNSCTPSTTLTTTESLLFQEHPIAKRLFPVVWKVKSESGELEDKPKLWKVLSRNIEVEFQTSKSTNLILKLFLPLTMDPALSGTS